MVGVASCRDFRTRYFFTIVRNRRYDTTKLIAIPDNMQTCRIAGDEGKCVLKLVPARNT